MVSVLDIASRLRLVVVATLLGCALAAQAGEPPGIVILGDSLSAAYGMAVEEGWVALLERRLRAQGYEYRVVNASLTGETSRGGRARLQQLLARQAPAVVVIELGGNDGLRGLPIAELRGNLDAIIQASVAAGARVLLLGMRIPPNYGPRYAAEFQALYARLADEQGVAYLPFILEDIALDSALMQEDGIHPRAAAQPLILERVWARLEPLLRELRAAGGAGPAEAGRPAGD